jgi:hypothetical protein
MLRAIAGLSPWRRRIMPKAVGFSEIGWGTLSVFWLAGAWWFA